MTLGSSTVSSGGVVCPGHPPMVVMVVVAWCCHDHRWVVAWLLHMISIVRFCVTWGSALGVGGQQRGCEPCMHGGCQCTFTPLHWHWVVVMHACRALAFGPIVCGAGSAVGGLFTVGVATHCCGGSVVVACTGRKNCITCLCVM